MGNRGSNPKRTALGRKQDYKSALRAVAQMDTILSSVIQSISLPAQEFVKSLQPLIVFQKEYSATIDRAVSSFHSISTLPIVNSIQSEAFRNMVSGFQNIHRGLAELPAITKDVAIQLEIKGWFFDHEMDLLEIHELHRLVNENKSNEIDARFEQHFASRAPEIEQSIIHRFPHREKVLSSAFSAHYREEYCLAIPVLLCQTDGICKDITGFNLFLKENGKPQASRAISEAFPNDFESAFVYPLTQPLQLCTSEKMRKPNEPTLNRHAVLHGESLDYGIKTNSLKAISLINYVANMATDEHRITNERND